MTITFRFLPAIPLAALLLAGIAHAETRASAVISAEGGYGSNPFFGSSEDDKTGSAVIRVRPTVSILGPTSTISFDGNVEQAFFASHYDDITNWSLGAASSLTLSPRSTLSLSAGYASTVMSNLAGTASPGLPLSPDQPIQIPDPSAAELAGQRSKTLNGGASFQTTISPRNSISLSANAAKTDYPASFGSSYKNYGGSISGNHIFNSRFSAGLGTDYSRTDYDDAAFGASQTFSPYVHGSLKLAPQTTLEVNLGASFSKLTGPNATPSKAYFSGRASLCHEGVRSNLCAIASRSVGATAQAGTSTISSLGANYRYTLSPHSSFSLDGQYSSTQSIALGRSFSTGYASGSAGYQHQLTERFSFTATARYTNPFKSIGNREKSFYGGVGVSYQAWTMTMNTQSNTFEATEESSIGAILPHLPTIIWSRKWLVILPALVGLIIGIAAAFLLPVTYQSKAVLLVEAPLLPDEIAADASGAEIIDQRMARIRQQVLSRSQLIDLINRNSLYQTELRIKTFSEVIDTMRGAIDIEPVTGAIQASANGKQSTIAFSISFNYSEPVKAQAVLQSITQQIQELNSTTQSEQASNMVQFLTDQTTDLQKQITGLENQMLQIKAQNGTALASANGGMYSSPELIQSQIIQIEQSNTTLRAQRDMTSTSPDRDDGVQAAEATLASLRATYAETHPDVLIAKRKLEEAKSLAKARNAALPVDRGKTIDDQIALNNRQIAQLRGAMGNAAATMSAARGAPVVQGQLSSLQEKLDGLNAQYQRAAVQLRAAQAGKRADDEQQGERLRQLEAPTIPEKPISPNRPMLIAAGFGFGGALGLAVIMLLEIVSRPIRHVSSVTNAIGEPPLVVIPTIYAPGERGMGFLAKLWPGGNDKDDDD